MTEPFVFLAGATGDLGGRIAAALVGRGATVHALVRDESKPVDRDRLTALGATVVAARAARPTARSEPGVSEASSC